MSQANEYAEYSSEELTRKEGKYKKLQFGTMIMAIGFAIIIAVYCYANNIAEGVQVAGLFLVTGIAYPLLTFGAMRKKMREELNNRKA